MLDSIKRYKWLLTTLVLVAGGYYAYVNFAPDIVPESLLSSQSARINGTAAGQEIVQILEEVKGISLDTSIFENQKFKDLIDLTQEVTSEPQGRENPFEPIGLGQDIQGKIAKPADPLDAIIIEPTNSTQQGTTTK